MGNVRSRMLRVIPLFLAFAAGTVASGLRLANAVERDDMETVRSLLAHKVDVDVAQVDGTTLLWAAHDNLGAVRLLLQAGAN